MPDRWRGRLVCSAMVVTLLVCAAGSLEPWPFTSFRLFSQVRTGRSTQVDLVATDDAGRSSTVTFVGNELVVRSAQRRIRTLPALSGEQQRTVALELLAVSDTDPGTVHQVVVRRTTLQLDPDSGDRAQVSSTESEPIVLR